MGLVIAKRLTVTVNNLITGWLIRPIEYGADIVGECDNETGTLSSCTE
jgi:O-acetylhomoserine/O-acetylserine sulfhydrylase-like pyridoxal-dependent enzyme